MKVKNRIERLGKHVRGIFEVFSKDLKTDGYIYYHRLNREFGVLDHIKDLIREGKLLDRYKDWDYVNGNIAILNFESIALIIFIDVKSNFYENL